ncbi:MAG TPA: YfiR family protein [Tepidisphaeraceae bacterium]|nr:YfiR family protein [Tepidisphaeraceae bacterium]
MTVRRFILTLLLNLVAAWPAAVLAQADGPKEYEVKAAFIYHFIQFTEWPAGSFANKQSPIVLATVGRDPFGGALEQICAGKSISGRVLVVKHFTSAADVKPCQVLFIAASSDGEMSGALKSAGSEGLLTVGETDRFVASGGIVRFYAENNRVRFEINQEAAERAHLRISAKLLRLAKPHGS